jgi:hypothetical protein
VTTTPDLSIFWDRLIHLLEEGKVVPVVGQDLLTIPEASGHTLLYPYLAERLAKYLRVPTDDLPEGSELNEVACRYLSKGKPLQHVYAALKTVAVESEALPLPEPLVQLAAIRPFSIFVTTTFDSSLTRALNHKRFGGKLKTRVFAHAPNEMEDLPGDFKSSNAPVVYHLMGKLSATPAYAVTHEDLIEFFHSLQSDTRRPVELFHELSRGSLLLLGTRFSGWLTSFLMRMSKRQRLSSDDKTDYGPMIQFATTLIWSSSWSVSAPRRRSFGTVARLHSSTSCTSNGRRGTRTRPRRPPRRGRISLTMPVSSPVLCF